MICPFMAITLADKPILPSKQADEKFLYNRSQTDLSDSASLPSFLSASFTLYQSLPPEEHANQAGTSSANC